ncbi:sensor histidine kinase [Jannaschia formosa]|uniref:sensor histidine kinase n=1 Tax=Jannaschia formosa TaxID=2259592 RepID=UPI000E1B5B23|nr:HWE histidine kinase domain-containing protein [Jannaschia formosa]TFL17271.1 GAF domain-containing protein [Jannaschia formosa]
MPDHLDSSPPPDALEAQADRLRMQRRALAEFGLAAFRSGDLDAVLNRACELVAEGLDAELAKVLEYRPEQGDFLVRAGVGWKPGVVGHEAFAGGESASPAGYALKRGEPVISPDLADEGRFAIPEVLHDHGVQSMVNVVIAGEDGPYGVLEVDAPRQHDFDEEDAAFLENYANLLAAAIERLRGHAELGQALSEQKVLVGELAHRVRNMLGLVQALASQTVAEDAGAIAYRDAFLGRLGALARAEGLVFEDHAQSLDLSQLAPRALAPFTADGPRAIVVDGPTLWLPARIGRILGLVLHELATNATKHGALSSPEGRVRLAWQSEEASQGDRHVRLRWSEEGGPAVTSPSRRGFGTRLLERLACYELEGTASLDYRPEGLCYDLTFEAPREGTT